MARLGGAVVLLVVATSAALVCGARPAWAQRASALQVSFTPGTIGVAPGGARKAVLLLANGSAARLTAVRLGFTSDPGITVTASAAPRCLGAAASATVVVSVTRAPGAPATASVEAVISYTSTAGGISTHEAAVAGLPVTTAPASAPVSAPIAVSASIGTAQLVEYQSTDAFFTIANDSGQPEALSSVVVTFPTFLTVEYLPAGRQSVVSGHGDQLMIPGLGPLAPGNSTVVHLHIVANQPLQPGDTLLVLTVAAQDQADHVLTTASAAQKLSLSVLGESGVLQLLGVPSLLFVPGLVFVVVLWALWRFVAPRTVFTMSADSGVQGRAAMWVFALLPSLAFPFLYPVVTGLLGQRRDYRTAYGLDDILYVWIMAATFAVLLWGIGIVMYYVGRRLYVPAENDLPLPLLRKFARRPVNRKLNRDTATYDDAQLVVVLQKRGATALVTPRINYQVIGEDTLTVGKLNGYIPGKPLRLYRFLKKKYGSELTLEYFPRAPQEPLSAPTRVDQSKLTHWRKGNLIVEKP
jgi:hypothetical protein